VAILCFIRFRAPTKSPATVMNAQAEGTGEAASSRWPIRNVALAILGAVILVLKSDYNGVLADVVHSYGGNVAASFALYFAVIGATATYRRSWLVAAALTLVAVQLFEVTDGFGVMENVYDPADLIANTLGVALAVVVDGATGWAIQWRLGGFRAEPRR